MNALLNIPGFKNHVFYVSDHEKISNHKCRYLCKWINANGKYPFSRSKDQNEKRLGKWLDNQRQGKLEKKGRIFYDSNLIIAKQYGLPNLFELIDREKESNNICYELCEWIKKNGRYPYQHSKYSKDSKEKKIGKWLDTQRQAKLGKKGRIFYDSNLIIAKQYGLPNLFDVIDREKESNKICHELCQWIKENNRYPSQHSKGLNEKRLGKWLNNQRQGKLGKCNSKFYGSNLIIAKQYEFPDLFERQK